MSTKKQLMHSITQNNKIYNKGKSASSILGMPTHPLFEREYRHSIGKQGFVLPGHQYEGPGNSLNNGEPTSETDALAQKHDIQYAWASFALVKKMIDQPAFEKAISMADDEFASACNLTSIDGLVGYIGIRSKQFIEHFTGIVYPVVEQPKPNEFADYFKKLAPVPTRNKTRHSTNTAIMTLNQIAQQAIPRDQRLPEYKDQEHGEKQHNKTFDCTLVFRDITKSAHGAKSKHEARTSAATVMLEHLKTQMFYHEMSKNAHKVYDAWMAKRKLEESEFEKTNAIQDEWVDENKRMGEADNPGPGNDFSEYFEPREKIIRPPQPPLPKRMYTDEEEIAFAFANFSPLTYAPVKPMNDRESLLDEIKLSDYKAIKEEVFHDEIQEIKDAIKQQKQNIVSKQQLTDHIVKMASMNGNLGDEFSYIADLLNISTNNRFALLADCSDVIEFNEEVEPLLKPKKTTKPGSDLVDVPKKMFRPEEKPVVQRPKALTEEERRENKSNAIARIVKSLIKCPWKVLAWVKRKMSSEFKNQILELVFGFKWQDKTNFSLVEWGVFCFLNNVSKDEEITVALTYDKTWTEADNKDDLAKEMGFSNIQQTALLHNKSMHALNGNILTGHFSEVLELEDTVELMRPNKSSLAAYTGLENMAVITNVVGQSNPNQTRLFDQDSLRGNMVSDTNALVSNCSMPLPCTNLIPRRVRVGEALANATRRLRVTECNTAEYYVNPIRKTELADMVADNIANMKTTNWRRDNNTIAGFSTFDIHQLSVAMIPKGLSLEEILLKLDMLHSILSLRAEGRMINASLFNAVDNATRPIVPRAIIATNNSPVFGEDCGGLADPEFPWIGGDAKGKIAFHACLASVPIGRREEAIVVPSAILQATDDPAEALALTALMFSEWPFCMYTVTKQTVGPGGADQENQLYVPTQTLTRIGSRRTIDLVYSKRTSEANPRTQDDANAIIVARPSAGPRAVGTLVGNQLLDVNFISADTNDFVQYNLVDYLLTWALRFDVTSIRSVISRLTTIVDVKDQLWNVHEINVALTQQIPKLMCANTPVASPAANTEAQFDMCYTSHMEVTRTTTDWPLDERTQADFRIFETNTATWNKVVLGLATADNIKAGHPAEVPWYLMNPQVNMWERIEAMAIACTWKVFYDCRGVTTRAWNTGYSDNVNVWLQDMVRDCFTTEQSTGTIIPARNSFLLVNLFKNMFERSPRIMKTSVGSKLMDITHFGRWLPGNEYANVYEGTAVIDGLTPCLVPDIWLQYMTINTPLSHASFPVPMDKDSVQGFNEADGLSYHRNQATNRITAYIHKGKNNQAYFEINLGPEMSDKSLWNNRLWFTDPSRIIADYAAQPLAEEMPTPNYYPVSRLTTLVGPAFVQPIGLGAAATTCIPRYSVDGQVIYIYLTQASAKIPIDACNRSARLARSAWLLSGVFRAVDIQAYGTTKQDIFKQLTEEYFLEVSEGIAIRDDIVPATVEGVREQAVIPQESPSFTVPSKDMVQPAAPNSMD